MRVSAACLANDRSGSAPRLALLDRKVICETVVMLIPFSCQLEAHYQLKAIVRCELGHKRSAKADSNEHIEGNGPTVFAHACKLGLEGIVSKRKDSNYRSGRSPDWLKMKNTDAPAVKREAEKDWGR
jgi:hypothetical protein